MKTRLIFLGFILLAANFSWTMDANKKANKKPSYYLDLCEYKKQHIVDDNKAYSGLAKKYQNDLKIIEDLLLEISGKNKEKSKSIKFCDDTISGNDWFVLLERNISLKTNGPAIIPWEKWQKYNCSIKISEITHDEVKITIIPDTLPIFGDHSLPDATWKAVVWLERPLEISKPETNILRVQANDSDQIRQCRRNLESEAEAINQKLTELLGLLKN